MTIGQRIAQKRKELGLSQEGLGDRLGVTRQSIYKWESDAALPEIDKLISLSRLFGVSVGWLLGVEEESAPSEPAGDHGGELTETQLQMVEEIVSRYLASQPKPEKSAWDKWSVRILFALCGVILAALLGISGNIRELDTRYGNLQGSVNNVTASVNHQIGSISSRVEELLEAQDRLTADHGVELTRRDLRGSTVSFDLFVVPKTYVEGMQVEFVQDDGQGISSRVEAVRQGERFSASVTVPLTDVINFSAVFLFPDGTRQTQLLKDFHGMYTESLPDVQLNEDLWGMKISDGTLVFDRTAHTRYIWTQDNASVASATAWNPAGESLNGPAEVRSIRVGLFKNQKLVAWAEPCDKPSSFKGYEDCSFYCLPDLELPLTAADTVQVAAVVEDLYDRTVVICNNSYHPEDGKLSRDPALVVEDPHDGTWEYE